MSNSWTAEIDRLHDLEEMDSWDGGHRSDYYEAYLEREGYIYRDSWTGEEIYNGPIEMGN